MSKLSQPQFHNEEAAILHLESILWPNGANCPHCGSVERLNRLKGKATRPGLWKCYNCRKQFTVKVGTVFESSHVPLTKWLQAAHLLASSKKGISAHQLHRILEVQYNTAWFMAHRLREAMRVLHIEPMGGEGKTVEADETYVGGKEKNKHAKDRKHLGRGPVGKEAVFSLVERGAWFNKKPTNIGATIKGNVNVVLEGAFTEYGAIEGKLLVLDSEDTPEFAIIEPLYSARILCTAAERDVFDSAYKFYEQRVEAEGLIKYSGKGIPYAIRVDKIFPIVPAEGVSDYKMTRGILKQYV